MTDQGPAGYSIYDVLRTLVERVGWPTEDEKRVVHRSIDDAERMRILGNLASDMVCDHPDDERRAGQCLVCGRQIENTARPAGWSERYRQQGTGYHGAPTRRGW